jgi:GNAT superfamily N-acetyltransferase
MNLKIRFIVESDLSELVELCEAHALYEKVFYDKKGKTTQLRKGLFRESPKLFCLVAESESGIVGYATYMKQYSTWDANEYIYMDCLFIETNFRGLALGEQFVRRIQEEAKKLNCSLIQWQTPDFNTRAIKFYHRIGASSKSKKRFFLEV